MQRKIFLHLNLPTSLYLWDTPYLSSDRINPDSTHYPIIRFSKEFNYQYYWVIENDIEFSGDWQHLIAQMVNDTADLIAAHPYGYMERPNWVWWSSLFIPAKRSVQISKRMDVSDIVKVFLPIYRISKGALDLIDSLHLSGWQGHFEVLIPTALKIHELRIKNLLDFGAFYLGSEQDPHPDPDLQSTLRWRPEITREEFLSRFNENTIYHPVKQSWTWIGTTGTGFKW